MRLFADRAAAVSPGFTVDGETRPLVTDIVRRLDGLPLAIELAAARLRTLPLAEISRRLDDRFRLLTGGSRTALPRHRTLRAVVEWSWDLLTPAERLLAERFSVFPAGATPEAVAAVCATTRRRELAVSEADDLLSSLVDKSLLEPVDGGARLRMLETIREYGAEKLAERACEAGELRRRPRRVLLRAHGGGRAAHPDPGPGPLAAGGALRSRQHPRRAALLVRRPGRRARDRPGGVAQLPGVPARQSRGHSGMGRRGRRGARRGGTGPADHGRGAVRGDAPRPGRRPPAAEGAWAPIRA